MDVNEIGRKGFARFAERLVVGGFNSLEFLILADKWMLKCAVDPQAAFNLASSLFVADSMGGGKNMQFMPASRQRLYNALAPEIVGAGMVRRVEVGDDENLHDVAGEGRGAGFGVNPRRSVIDPIAESPAMWLVLRMKRIPGFLAFALITVFITIGCKTVPETGRKQLNFISAGQEMQLGLTSFDQVKKETPISKDPAANALVQRVGKRIAAAASKDLPNAQWEFVVFESKEANAFCLPGGKVGVYTGLLPITKDEAGLATVIGHETAHAALHHGSERMSEALVMQSGGQVLNSALGASSPQWQAAAATAYGLGTKVGRELPHSRAQESEADRVGLTYMARAGYDPSEALRFWERFAAYSKQAGGGGSTPTIFRDHPADEKRIADLQKLLPQAEAEYRAAGGIGASTGRPSGNRLSPPAQSAPSGNTRISRPIR